MDGGAAEGEEKEEVKKLIGGGGGGRTTVCIITNGYVAFGTKFEFNYKFLTYESTQPPRRSEEKTGRPGTDN